MQNRRSFIRNASLLSTGLFLTSDLLAAIKGKVSANDKIGLGVIGCKGQGWNNLKALLKVPEVECVALCDIDENILNERKSELNKLNIKPKTYSDYRRLISDKDVKIVVVATPDHWHCLIMIEAIAAGKDVFCEKPVANSIYEAQLMAKAAQHYGQIVQVAQWQRSQQHFKDAINYVHSGKLGKISSTKAWMYRGNTKPLPIVPDSKVPVGVDYEMWLGPATKHPFNVNRFHYEFRWFWDYAGGLMTDWGVHLIDMILLGMNADIPKSVIATGGKYVFPNDARQTPDIQMAVYDFGNFEMSWEHNMATGQGLYGMQHGIAFIGENGTLLLNRGGWSVNGEKDKLESLSWAKSIDNGLDNHAINFIDVVKSRKKEELNCPIEAGAKVAIVSHFGNIAYRTGEKIQWDAEKNSFNIEKASQLIKPVYHNGWKLPTI
ncbi:MAG: oxidoreductase [Pseudopedobacter saltans]|uniref:Oxidoreductase n=1 Tax=Pseudopedobacter saltans TaxID=151895 RepID=A0A2W5F9F7_9SPHI|nr:MAG: oxidoreductase [Pseudopedobacter saltans]